MEKYVYMPVQKPLNFSKENAALAEQFFSQVSESIQLIFDLTSRIDERVKMLIARQDEMEERIEKMIDMHQSLLNRLSILEYKENPLIKEEVVRIKEHILSIFTLETDNKQTQEKIRNLEVKIEMISMRLGNHDSRWLLIFDALWKVGLMIAAGIILYKLGIQSPPLS